MRLWWFGYTAFFVSLIAAIQFETAPYQLAAFIIVSVTAYFIAWRMKDWNGHVPDNAFSLGFSLSEIITDLLAHRPDDDAVFRLELTGEQMRKIRDGLRSVGDVAA